MEEYVYAPKINWKAILQDLDERNTTLYRVSIILGVSPSTAQRWRDVKGDIGYGYGRALLRLHAKVCGAGLTFQRMAESEAAE